MFSLIITVISIALVAALAVASVYYGGPALSKGTARAAAATVVSQGQQISGAATMFSSDTAKDIAAFADLTGADPAYLTSIPTPPNSVGTEWLFGATATGDEGYATITSASADVCLEVERNRDSGITELPPGVADLDAAVLVGQFGCVGNTATPPAFKVYYKL